MIDGYFLGYISATSLVAALFFLRFWRNSGDYLFLAFAAAFAIEGLNRVIFLFLPHPETGPSAIYWIRFFAFLLIVVAIVAANQRSAR